MNNDQQNIAFYDEFSDMHDTILPLKDRLSQKQFFKFLLNNYPQNSKILDSACGTGIHSILFLKMGFNVNAMDISKGMVKKARENFETHECKIPVAIGDFRKIDKIYKRKFDIITCLGNSLPHMLSEGDLLRALKSIYNSLTDDGVALFSQRNYDLLLKKKPRHSLSLQGNHTFLYLFDYHPKKIVFNIIIGTQENNKTTFKTLKTIYNPIGYKYLTSLLEKVGFSKIQFFNQENKSHLYKFNPKKDYFFSIRAQKGN